MVDCPNFLRIPFQEKAATRGLHVCNSYCIAARISANGIVRQEKKSHACRKDCMSATMDSIRRRIIQAMGTLRAADLARLTGVTDSSISRYLKNLDPSLPFVIAVCEALAVSAHWLLFGVGPMKAGDVDLSRVSYERLIEETGRRVAAMRQTLETVLPMAELLTSDEGKAIFRRIIREAGANQKREDDDE
jgi:transcriptional regulator with XRE-family HTH domain